ncbi:alcohol dehydrogenase catalytic domain-containing protein [Xanthobacter sp. V0B-10]
MKAIEFHEFGGPDVLHLVEVVPPHTGPGGVRIKVRAAGVNPSDWKRREGQYRAFEELQFPAGLGVEGAGIVDEIGQGVIGDALFGFGLNTMAEQAILTHWARKPDNVSFEVAAGLPVISDTATRALDQVGAARGADPACERSGGRRRNRDPSTGAAGRHHGDRHGERRKA